MKKIDWLKLDTGFFEDEKIVLLLSMKNGEKIVIFFLRLLTISAKQNQNGLISFSENVAYSVKNLAKICKISPKKCEDFLKILENFEIIYTEFDQKVGEISEKSHQNKFIFITNWAKHQSLEKLDKIRLQNAQRQRRHRDKQEDSNVTVTLRNGTDKETDTDTDTDTESETEKEKNNKEISSSFSDASSSDLDEKPITIDETEDKASLDGNSDKSEDKKSSQDKDREASKEKEKASGDASGKISRADKLKKKRLEQAQEVLTYLNQTTGRNFRLTKSFQGSVNGRLGDGYSVQDLKTVILKKTQEWKGTEWEKYLAPDTLFSPKKFDKYLNQPWSNAMHRPPKGGISDFGKEDNPL